MSSRQHASRLSNLALRLFCGSCSNKRSNRHLSFGTSSLSRASKPHRHNVAISFSIRVFDHSTKMPCANATAYFTQPDLQITCSCRPTLQIECLEMSCTKQTNDSRLLAYSTSRFCASSANHQKLGERHRNDHVWPD